MASDYLQTSYCMKHEIVSEHRKCPGCFPPPEACVCEKPVSAAPHGPKCVPLPEGAGRIISMIVFRDQLIVAFEYGVYRRLDDTRNIWEQLLP